MSEHALQRVIHDPEADLRLLSLANEKRKFAIQIGYPMDADLQFAFERGIDNEWFTLVDISHVASAVGAGTQSRRLLAAGILISAARRQSAWTSSVPALPGG